VPSAEGLSGAVGQPRAALAEATAAPIAAPVSVALAIAEAPLPSDLQVFLDDIERELLHRALQKHRYNRAAAGESLGLTLRHIRYRMAPPGVLSDKDGD
jgi:two-component system response regulator PilR (NtrC family)